MRWIYGQIAGMNGIRLMVNLIYHIHLQFYHVVIIISFSKCKTYFSIAHGNPFLFLF